MKKVTSHLVAFFFIGVMAVNLNSEASNTKPAIKPDSVSILLTDEMGPVFVNAEGYTLYSWRKDDRANKSKCNADHYERVLGRGQAVNYLPNPSTRPTCEQAWRPFRPAKGNAVVGDVIGRWQVMVRHDQSLQWSYKGKPVYQFSYETQPGQMLGAGMFYGGRNSILGRTPLYAPLNLPPGISSRNTKIGYTLANAKGFTLYKQLDNAGDCDRDCAQNWKPFSAPVSMILKNDEHWSFVQRQDGTRQWAHKGIRLYTFVEDTTPGDVNGAIYKDWEPAILYPRIEPPAEITVQMTGNGEVYADKKGMTLYSFYCFDEAPDHLSCDIKNTPERYRLSICGTPENCMATWQPVIASKEAMPAGNTWTIVSVDPTGVHLFTPDESSVEALSVWAYNGRPVFTYAMDKGPGDIMGDKVSHLVDWGFWMLKK